MAARPARRPLLLAALFVGLLAHVHLRNRPDPELGTADRAVLAVTAPIERGLWGGLRGLGRLADHYLLLVGVSRRNAELEEGLRVARAATAELAELRSENQRLREVAGLRLRTPGVAVGASVIGRGIADRFHTVRIDRGTADGVEPGAAVVASDGAVGQVLRASDSSADVLLLTDELSGVGAVVQRSRQRGVMGGDGDRALRLGFVPRADQIHLAAGDEVVTSGEDGVFPPGVPLGRVLAVGAPRTGLFLEVEVEPAVALERVEDVLVIVQAGVGPWLSPELPAPAVVTAPVVVVPEARSLVGPALPPPASGAGDR